MMNVWFSMLQPLGNARDSIARSKQTYDVTYDGIWPDVRFKDYRPAEVPSNQGWLGTSQPILKRSIPNYQGRFTAEGKLIEQAIQLIPVLHARLAERFPSLNAALDCRPNKSDEQSNLALHSYHTRSSTPREEDIGATTGSTIDRAQGTVAEETNQGGRDLHDSVADCENGPSILGDHEPQDAVDAAVQTYPRISWTPISDGWNPQLANRDRVCSSASLLDDTIVFVAGGLGSVLDVNFESTFATRLRIVHQFWKALLERDSHWQAVRQAQKMNQRLIGIRILT